MKVDPPSIQYLLRDYEASRYKDLDQFEMPGHWKEALKLFHSQKNINMKLFLRIMFVLIDQLVEGEWSKEEHDHIAVELKNLFNLTQNQFFENAEFLFFTGIMACMGEWYFGIDYNTSIAMLKKATTLEPNNILYKWGYWTYAHQTLEANTEKKLKLAAYLLFEDTSYLNALKEKGLLGKYVWGAILSSYESITKYLGFGSEDN